MGKEIILADAPLEQAPRLMQNGPASFGQSGAHKYFLAGLWQLHLYHDDGEIQITNSEWFGDTTLIYPIRPGTVSFLPPDTHSEYHLSRPGSFYYAHLALNGSRGAGVPVMQYLDHDRGEMERLFEEAIGLSATREWRAEMKIWEFVCRLSERGGSRGPEAVGDHPAVARARQFIALRLDQPIGVPEIAHAAGVSHCHLNRLFHAELAMPVKRYLTQQRMSRARYLLTYSSQPIKSIAADVGIPDLHLFNKVVRRHLGAPPTLVREERSSK
ncbi:MAG: xylR [Capsulimonas sp.]|nr:xylR [Capsulimonas sp.]